MAKSSWQIYLSFILGGLILLILSIVSLYKAHTSHMLSHTKSLMCADLGISSLNVMIGKEVSLSRYKWDTSNVSHPFTVGQILSVLEHSLSDTDDIGKETFNFYSENSERVFSATFSNASNMYLIEGLLESFLESPLFSQAERKKLLDFLPCISAEYTESFSGAPDGLSAFHSDLGVNSFIWVQKGNPSLKIAMLFHTETSLALFMTNVIVVTILLMLILIWKGLLSLEDKKKTFRNFTKEVVKGNAEVPKNLSDDGTLEELADSFDSMSSHIQRLLRVQRDMTNAISHELRTPIARLRFGLESLKDDVDESAFSAIDGLEGDVEELNTLVDEVLTYGKLEDGGLILHFTEVDIGEIIFSIVENNESLMSHFDIEVTVDSKQSTVLADPHHLHRALQNLILNASKYAKHKVKISFECDDVSWRIDIEDDGPGIAFEDRDKVFIPFQRLDNSRTRSSGGYGLGLAIVQKIAFWHGGAVLIDGSSLGGAKFSFIWSRTYHKKDVS